MLMLHFVMNYNNNYTEIACIIHRLFIKFYSVLRNLHYDSSTIATFEWGIKRVCVCVCK